MAACTRRTGRAGRARAGRSPGRGRWPTGGGRRCSRSSATSATGCTDIGNRSGEHDEFEFHRLRPRGGCDRRRGRVGGAGRARAGRTGCGAVAPATTDRAGTGTRAAMRVCRCRRIRCHHWYRSGTRRPGLERGVCGVTMLVLLPTTMSWWHEAVTSLRESAFQFTARYMDCASREIEAEDERWQTDLLHHRAGHSGPVETGRCHGGAAHHRRTHDHVRSGGQRRGQVREVR